MRCWAICVLAGLFLSIMPVKAAEPPSSLDGAMAAKAYGPEILDIIGNLIAHDSDGVPDNVFPATLDALRRPASVPGQGYPRVIGILAEFGLPEALQRIDPASPSMAGNPPDPIAFAVDHLNAHNLLLRELTASASRAGPCCNPHDLIGELAGSGPEAGLLSKVGGAAIGRAARNMAGEFISRSADLARAIEALARHGGLGAARATDTAFGRILIGTNGADRYRLTDDVALIIDPAGDDVYELESAVLGRQRTIVDLDGDDRYIGAGLAVQALTALLDLGGNDRYEGGIGAQAAALGAVALLLDRAGNDTYTAESFAQAAAAHGVAVLVDAAGDDRYEIASKGQALGWVDGIAVLWDRLGNDVRQAAGPRDTVGRDGSISLAQGMGIGLRAGQAGGIGLLLDDDGDDVYRASMFAQGSGYYFGMGILSDRVGSDRYDAVRYAQGAGAHSAVGLLMDDAGNDAYAATQGVSQGMGLDLSVGVLLDSRGDDTYAAGSLAQGAGTANGIGILMDQGGRDRFSLGAQGWGQDHAARGLPGPAFLIGAGPEDRFERDGKPVAIDRLRADGPGGAEPPRSDPPGDYACPTAVPTGPGPANAADPLALIGRSAPMFGSGPDALAAYGALVRRLPGDLPRLLRAIPARDVASGFALVQVVRCYLTGTGASERREVWNRLTAELDGRTPVDQLWIHARLLRLALDPDTDIRTAVSRLTAFPACSVRAAAIGLVRAKVAGQGRAGVPDGLLPALRAALGGGCFQEQAEVLGLLDTVADRELTSVLTGPAGYLPEFLADPTLRARFRQP
jgi:hypothetical protein